jgi:hypothetical protein
MAEEIPEYLGRESARERKMLARFRNGNEERENRYWMEGEEIRCRMCFEEKNKAFVVIFTIEHFALLFLVKRNQKRFLVQLD